MHSTIVYICIRPLQTRKERWKVVVMSLISDFSILCVIKTKKKGNLFFSFFACLLFVITAIMLLAYHWPNAHNLSRLKVSSFPLFVLWLPFCFEQEINSRRIWLLVSVIEMLDIHDTVPIQHVTIVMPIKKGISKLIKTSKMKIQLDCIAWHVIETKSLGSF